MIKTLSSVLKQDKEKFTVPRNVQDMIPVKTIWPDGIFLNAKGKYSKMYRFTDINYAVASREDKESLFIEYSELLNSLDSGSTTKITINNRRLNRLDFEENILLKLKDDDLDSYREEYNGILTDKATGSNSIIQDKYLTISVNRKSIEDARLYFSRVGSDLTQHFNSLGSVCHDVDAVERLRIIHDFMRTGEETSFHFDIKDHMRRGADFRDYVCPDSYENHSDYFKIGNRFGRVLLLRDYASYIKDEMVAELTAINRSLMLSIDVVPVPTDEAVREVEQRLLGVETNITNWQRKQNMNNNFSAVVPYDMEQQRKESKEFLDDLVTRDQRMMFAVLTLVHTADTKKELDNDTEEILTIARKRMCQMAVLRYQQLDGLKTALPYGVRKIDAFRTLTTESLAVFMSFRVQEVYDHHGIYYGQNVISGNMMIADRRRLLNGNSFILGVSGSGKSFTAKNEITNLMLGTDADIIVVDPEREYAPLVNALGGSVIEISATSANHINAMDMSREYGETDPIIEKSQFLQSLCEQIIAGHRFQKGQQSIIDRCTENVYRYYQQGNYMGTPPTLQDFRDELLKQPEPEAHSLALELELFTRGSLNTFASKKAAEKTAKGAKRTLQAVVKGIKAAAVAVKTLYAALVAAGSSAVAIIVICTLFASSLYLFGNDTNDEYSAEALGVGDTLIMRVASAQLGNVGGKKFWSWYGFEGRVEWCAIFVSWCGNQCGYIEKGIIPRFAVVGDGVDWFKARKRFQNNTYIPHPGDIIFFDWGADGTRDHVGFVERCDGKTVYTIEGNSGDACKRLAYRVGSPVIIGYGVPAYPLPQSNSKSKSKATGNDLENRPNVRFGIIQTADFNTPVSSSAQG